MILKITLTALDVLNIKLNLMKSKLLLILTFVFLNTDVYSQKKQKNKQKTEAGEILKDGKDIAVKAFNWIVDKFPRKHKIPKTYIPVSEITQTTRDSFNKIQIIKETKTKLELKVLYPRITPSKGFVSFQLGDFTYFRYLKDVSIDDIESIILRSADGSECYVEKFRLIPKNDIKRNYSFILDHSGSMGGRRANELQTSVFNAIKKDLIFKNTKKSKYSVYKFDHKNRRIVSSNNIDEIEKYMMPSNKLKGFGGGTAIKDAILSGVEDLSLDKDSETKIMILFTDGETNSDVSIMPMSDIIKKALVNNINIVTVAFGSHLSKSYLENISLNSGGSLYWIYNESEFEQLFDNVLSDVNLSYDLEFSPCMFGEEIEIELKVKGIESTVSGKTIFRSPADEGFSIDVNILFKNGAWTIQKINYDKLDQLVQLMNYRPDMKILVEGHTDKLGSEKTNQWLSEKRANSVKEYLLKKGISEYRIETKGFGSSKPAYSYYNSDVNELNRRIEIVITN